MSLILSRAVNAGSSDRHPARLIQDGAHDGAFNMAADRFLSEWVQRTRQPVLRLYEWAQPTWSLGFHQRLSETQLDQCRQTHVPLVRRPTGGRAVLHDQELTYALALPTNHELLKQGKHELLKNIGLAFVLAASKIGLAAELVRLGQKSEEGVQKLNQGSPLCFASISRWEVRLQDRKWIGSAQRVFAGAFLQHGSILTGAGSINPAIFFADSASQVPEIFSSIAPEDLRQAIPAAFSEHFSLDWYLDDFRADEQRVINSTFQDENQVARARVA